MFLYLMACPSYMYVSFVISAGIIIVWALFVSNKSTSQYSCFLRWNIMQLTSQFSLLGRYGVF